MAFLHLALASVAICALALASVEDGLEPKLATAIVQAEGASPSRWIYMMHGSFGAGRNWSSVARRLVRDRPEWGALLIDLRQHGASRGFPAPHTMAAAAEDVARLADAGEPEPAAVLGHSLGGKVALAFARMEAPSLEQVWVVDSTPAARQPGGSAWGMLGVIRSLPDVFPDRDSMTDQLVSRGVERPVAQWMATNLEGDENGYRWRFDVEAIEQMLVDFFETDFWSVVEDPPTNVQVHLVKAEESSVLSGDDLERAERATKSGRTFVHRVSGGHWVNADNPEALHDLLAGKLPST